MKFATIGSGMIVDLFIQSAHNVENVRCDLVYSRSLVKACEFAQKHGVARFVDDLDALVNDSIIDTVYIASPNSLHFMQAKMALEAKKNVILEKPVCASVKEYETLMQIAKAHGVYIVEAITNAHCASMQYMKDNLAKLGNVKCILANFSQYSSRYDLYKQGQVTNVFDPKMEGGALVDIGVYNLYVCVHLFGKPLSYQYIANIGFNGIDTSGCLILQYPSFFACLTGAKDCSAPNVFTIEGDEASFIIDEGSAGRCKHVSLYQKGKIVDEYRQSDIHMEYEISDFSKAFEKRSESLINQWNQETLDVLEIMENARKQSGVLFEKEKN